MKTKSIKGTETEKNLMKTFSGEAQSVCRYKFFSKQAKKEGFPQIAGIFKATAKNKMQHSKIFYGLLEGGKVEITAAYPAGPVGDTLANLMQAAATEHEKWEEIYPEYAKVAQDEGFTHIATLFHHLLAVDTITEELFNKLAEELSKKTLYKSKEETTWRCRKCGHHHHGTTPPDACPLCSSPKEYFQRECCSTAACDCR